MRPFIVDPAENAAPMQSLGGWKILPQKEKGLTRVGSPLVENSSGFHDLFKVLILTVSK